MIKKYNEWKVQIVLENARKTVEDVEVFLEEVLVAGGAREVLEVRVIADEVPVRDVVLGALGVLIRSGRRPQDGAGARG